MTISKFFAIFGLQLVLLMAVKIFFYSTLNFNDTFWQVAFLLITVVLATALIRRLGVISFLEAIFTLVFWFLFDLLMDLLVTSQIVDAPIFKTGSLWMGYLAMMLAVFLLHKKRHIHIRKELAAHHHHSH